MDKEILTMEEAAELFNVSVKTFIKLLKEEKVPARKIGREWRFSRKALIEWLSSGDSQVYTSSEVDTKEFFNEVANKWEELSREYYDESIKARILESEIFNKNMLVVDLGSADGYISRAIAPFVSKVIAVDSSAKMLEELKKKALVEGISNVETLENIGNHIPIEKNTVDAICANMFLHHIEEPEDVIKEIHRVLKSGGKVVISDFEEHSNQQMKEKMHDIWMGFNVFEVKKWFETSGFKEIKINRLQNQNSQTIFMLTAIKN